MKAYFNGNIFTGKKTVHGQCLLTENGRVTRFSATVPQQAERIDLQGRLLAPAFFGNLQIYGGNGHFFGEFPTVGALAATYQYCLAGGASHFLPTVATHSEKTMLAAIEAVREYWRQGGAGVLGLHLEGPFLNPKKRGAHLVGHLQKPTLKNVKKLFSQGRGVVKMMTVAPEICPPEVLGFLVKQKQVVISAGHSDATFEEATAAFDLGIGTATHVFNAMSALGHRAPGMVGAIFNHPKVRASLVADGFHVDFEAIKIAKKMMGDRLFLITDAVTANPDGQYSHRLDGEKYVLADGTLSGSALTMLKAVKNCVQFAGIGLEEALRMASMYPAQVMGFGKKFGKIGAGFDENFLLLDEKLEIVARFGAKHKRRWFFEYFCEKNKMTENNFYENLLDLPRVKVDKVSLEGKKLQIHCHLNDQSECCPNCAVPTHVVHQYTERKVQDLSIVGKEVWLVVRTAQYRCIPCNRYFNQPLGFADANKSYTHRQAKWIFELCAQQPFTEVGALVNLSHKTVGNLYFERARRQLQVEDRFKKVRRLGIDEISHRKGKRDFCCVLTDLDRGIELDILPDRKKETLKAYFKGLGETFCHQITVVCCDIWEPYILVARECFPNADITIDRFHVVKALNDGLDAFRKTLRKDFKDVGDFKKLKWILFKQPQNCSEEQKKLLQKACLKSPVLGQLYVQRNLFHDVYNTAKSTEQMEELLVHWIEQTQKLGQTCFDKFIKTLNNWKHDIATFAKTALTNAATEGLNNLIRHIKRISFGIPNFQHLRLRVLTLSA